MSPAASRAAYRPSWFHQSLAISGAAAVIALFISTGLYIGIGDGPVELSRGPGDVAMNRRPAQTVTPAEEPSTPDLSTAEDSPYAVVRPAARRRHTRTRPSLAAYRPRRRPLLPTFWVSQFFPTTLVIYAENGEIKTRIEPWLTAAYRKPLAFPN